MAGREWKNITPPGEDIVSMIQLSGDRIIIATKNNVYIAKSIAGEMKLMPLTFIEVNNEGVPVRHGDDGTDKQSKA